MRDPERGAEDGGWRPVGAHLLREERPDLVFIRYHGDLSAAELGELFEAAERLAATAGPVLWLCDVVRLGHIPVETRKFVQGRNLRPHIRAVGSFGGGYAARVAMTLAYTAARLTLPASEIVPMRMFATEAEARAWLAALPRQR